ncbi:helix-turn-helix domain-containing protein [Romboutsia lituseburensis]|uniref:helix-turn-helix domain-containing protein n=1 Tax=Romboutsia lituseburensis TaxID=1537 RepID=UPI00215B702B|nr:helix-turn-helix domain-containing protein [Romboutsia lituseburensis]MCR8747243.1 helix-turn-helix domain-containing protein [Romboutsia lituseburensis]
MAKGSFEGLYTFMEVSKIYGMDDSSLRKQVARDKFVIDEDIKKMGRTWIITEQAMVKNFGTLKFEEYKNKESKKKKVNAQNIKQKTTGSRKKVDSMNAKEEKVKDSWVQGDIKGIEIESFSFNTNNE